MKKLLPILALWAFSITLFGQMPDPVSWRAEAKATRIANEFDMMLTATIQHPWHMYDTGPYQDGPNATAFTFSPGVGCVLVDKVRMETKPHRAYDNTFRMEVGTFSGTAVFIQRVRVTAAGPVQIKGSVEYQVCDDQSCLAPTEWDFSVELKGAAVTEPAAAEGTVAADSKTAAEAETVPEKAPDNTAFERAGETTTGTLAPEASTPVGGGSFWSVILEAILWGFVALLTPCVFPMVPMTVSFFIKSNEGKRRGRFMALLYGISIVALYTLPIAVIILVTYFAGGETVTADIFNWLATHWIPNVLFFLVFMVFAASFFGAFEIRMPSRLVNKSDAKADKGGLVGVFFMALTLVLVSFSCTGPIVGSILIKSTQGEIWEPIITMLAFSIAFALPFTIFAFFPSMLKNLPKSGGWLNAVKVTLGFLETALGLKFLSVADQTYHWGILDREVYLAIWIAVFALLGVYLLGKLKFAHDNEVKHIGAGRLFLAIITLSFVVYLVPGMWGAPLKGLSGYLPPLHTQDFILGPDRSNSPGEDKADGAVSEFGFAPKYSDFLHLEHGLQGFFDYEEALAYSRKVQKPLFVDFTGHGCVNCREMEMKVWSDPRVMNLLRERYVIVALYSDDKKEVPESEWIETESGKVLKSLGKINSYIVNKKFGMNAQPYYVLLGPNEKVLAPPRGYDLDVAAFVRFLETGLANYARLE
ncbi:MAG: thioredoxin family protein [Rikenellaceae bacterium]|jgi:thiol:disulfide interchange protein DsbD|nr:thioredoxin family protein [Rikenellaceae bacterium]